MRYNHESYLPIRAFQPVFGRMTFHGGGGGGILDTISDAIGTGGGDSGVLNVVDQGIRGASDAAAAVDSAIIQPVTAPISQAASALDDAVIQPVTAPISDIGVSIDHAVSDVIPGGWGTLAQVAAAIASSGMSLPAQAAIAAGVGAGSNYAKNKDLKKALESGAISGATRYGIGTLSNYIGPMFGNSEAISADADAQPGGFYGESGNVNVTPVPNPDLNVRPYGPEEATSSLQKVSNPTIEDIIKNSNLPPTMTDSGVKLDPITLEPLPPDSNLVKPLLTDPKIFNPPTTTDGVSVNPYTLEKVPNEMLYQAPKDGTFLEAGANYNAPSQGYDVDAAIKEQAASGLDAADIPEKYQSPIWDKTNPNTAPIKYESSWDKLKQIPGAAYDTGVNYAKTLSPTDYAIGATGLYALSKATGGGNEPDQTPAAVDAANKAYTYGTAGKTGLNYLLKNKINANNIYSDAAGYRPLTRYAQGGEVQHFGVGGDISDYLTKIAQPIERGIIRPIGENVPFARDLAPYAGVIAGAAMANPAMAAGVGGLASGFGKPGGFDMKRALMGGIAAYGMSNVTGGLEAAGGSSAPILADAGTDLAGKTTAAQLVESGLPPEEALKQAAQQNVQQGVSAGVNNPTFRDPAAMQRGIGNLLENSNTPAYKDAMTAFKGSAGLYSAGVPIVMGLTGMTGVDESNALKAEYDKATAENQAETDKFNAKTAAGKKRAQQAVTDYPYKFATGGEVNPPDDQTQLPNQTPIQSTAQQGPLQGMASNASSQIPYGLGGTLNNVTPNNGINGLFNQLTSNQSNNSMPYNTQTIAPQSVVLPSYGNNGSPNNIASSTPAIGNNSGGAGGNNGTFPLQGQYGIVKMAAGGMLPRFLSGGGDGMSDSIRANIEGTQEARLADGEFVIPADVVSHLGNGSSKAGAKQLYDMMDRVRKARTGNTKQGREITPTKLMPV